MNQIRDQLDDAIGVAPPSAIDVDGLMQRQRKIVRVRWWGAAGGVATAVLGIGVASALAFSGGTPGGVLPGSPGGPAEPASAAATSRAPKATEPQRDFDPKTAKRFSEALRASLTKELPDTSFAPTAGAREKVFEFRSENHIAYQSTVDTRDDAGAGYISIVVSPRTDVGVPTKCDGAVDRDGLVQHRISCRVETGDHGETIVIVTADNRYEQKDESKRIRSHMVFVTKKDGTGVSLWSRNVSTVALGGDGGVQKSQVFSPTRPTPPLSTEQMVRVALHPDLTLTQG